MDKPNTQTIEDHLTRIQQIDELARRTITDQQRRIPEKYSNIEATLKLLTNLIHSFKKRSESHELQLKGRAKIDDLIDQITFHKARVLECEQMSATLMQKINERRQAIEREEERVRKLRKGIIELKTDNVKKIIRLEQLEKEDKNVVEKENLETRRNTWKVKTEVNREFYKEINRQKYHDIQIDSLRREKQEITAAIYRVLDQKTIINTFLDQLLSVTKCKLCHKQRKANLNGLNGSLMFKMIENNKPAAKSLLDNKLIIYDVLKQKHRAHLKGERDSKTEPKITREQFMTYTPLQILGIIELKGGINNLKQKIAKSESKQQQRRLLRQHSQKTLSLNHKTDI